MHALLDIAKFRFPRTRIGRDLISISKFFFAQSGFSGSSRFRGGHRGENQGFFSKKILKKKFRVQGEMFVKLTKNGNEFLRCIE